MEARLTPIRVSTIGAETSGHSISVARKTGGVLPESDDISDRARADHASISSKCRIADKDAVSILLSQRASRSAGRPPARRPLPRPWLEARRQPLSPRWPRCAPP